MDDTDYDLGWDAGYRHDGRTPPSDIENPTEWFEGYDDGRAYRESQDEDRLHAAMWID